MFKILFQVSILKLKSAFKLLVVFPFIFVLISCASSVPGLSDGQAKNSITPNIILFIGDGMGPSVSAATRIQFYGTTGSLHMDRLPYTAKVKTYSLNYKTTDSAAAATAMATGFKVNNGVLNEGPKATPLYKTSPETGKDTEDKDLTTILEIAARKGYHTGIVCTSHILHATPAGFYAHTNDRNKDGQIAEDLAQSPVDVILGGGIDIIAPYKENLQKRFSFIKKIEDLNDECDKGPVLGVFAKKNINYAYEDKSTRGLLTKMSLAAVECLIKKEAPFFMMIEGSRIDHALHARKIVDALYETKEFDDAIGSVKEFLKSKGQLKNTLILVTADHDTGGLSLNGWDLHKDFFKETSEKSYHIYNAQAHHIYAKNKQSKNDPDYPVLKLSTDFLEKKNRSEASHTSVDVDLYAEGPGAAKIHGVINNTDIFKIMKNALE